jgi:hypothetical protein
MGEAHEAGHEREGALSHYPGGRQRPRRRGGAAEGGLGHGAAPSASPARP